MFTEPITLFRIFLFRRWPAKDDSTFTSFGDEEVKSMLKHFAHRFNPQTSIKAIQEWLLFKHAALQKISEYQLISEHQYTNSEHSDSDLSEEDIDEETKDDKCTTRLYTTPPRSTALF